MRLLSYLAIFTIALSAHAQTIINEPFPQEARTSFAFGAGLPGDTMPDGSKLANVTSIALTNDGRVVAGAISSLQNIELLEFDGQTWYWVRPFFEHVSNSPYHSFVASTSGKAYRGDAGDAQEDDRFIDGSRWPNGMSVLATGSKVWEDTAKKRRVAFHSGDLILSVAAGPNQSIAVGTVEGLFLRDSEKGEFVPLAPADAKYSWNP
ncbi:MAG: hypothetical protein KJ060_19190, partial [Candidatus Hydrogenedentes bacterium]|nr:hypothetical protein [Candidatus Hydrogenedentota bacterium]